MKKLALVAFVTLGLLAWFVLDTLQAAGHFKTIEPHFDGSCRPVGGMPGPEDITVHPDTGIAFISSTDRRAQRAGQAVRGAIYALDLGSTEPEPTKLITELGHGFQPHGLSLFRGPDDQESLFVVSHPDGRHTVEIFDVRAGALAHRETLTDELLRSPNDVLAVGPRQFYATNDHRHTTGFRRTAEDLLRRADSDIVYYDGERVSRGGRERRLPQRDYDVARRPLGLRGIDDGARRPSLRSGPRDGLAVLSEKLRCGNGRR